MSFLYLVAGFVSGALMLAGVAVGAPLRFVHADWMLMGFMLQLAFGVAAWILPKTPLRRSSAPVWLVFGLLNAGLVLASAGAWLGHGRCLSVGRGLVLVGALSFASYIWPRVRSFKEKMVG